MRSRLLLVPAVAAAAALLTGCNLVGGPATPSPASNGVEAKEPDAILGEATQALGEAESVHVAGTVGEGMLGLTLDLTYVGEDMTGTVNAFGLLVSVIKVGGDFYLKADAALFEQFLTPEQQAQMPDFSTKWIKINLDLVETLLPLPLTAEELVGEPAGPLTKGEVTTAGGTQAITVTDANGVVYHVAMVGEPYVLDITAEGEKSLVFSGFGEAVTVEAPPDEEILDILEDLGLT